MFNLDIESISKICSILRDVGRALVKKKVLKPESKEVDIINNKSIYDTYFTYLWHLYFREEECEKKLSQGKQSGNGLKA